VIDADTDFSLILIFTNSSFFKNAVGAPFSGYTNWRDDQVVATSFNAAIPGLT